MDPISNTLSIFFYISLGFNLLFLVILLLIFIFRGKKKKSSNITFDEAFYILSNVIDNHRSKFFKGLRGLRSKFAVLGLDGKITQPNERIKEYSKKKKELKIAIIKKIFREISLDLRVKLLEYYTENGLISYISTELDKSSEIGGIGN